MSAAGAAENLPLFATFFSRVSFSPCTSCYFFLSLAVQSSHTHTHWHCLVQCCFVFWRFFFLKDKRCKHNGWWRRNSIHPRREGASNFLLTLGDGRAGAAAGQLILSRPFQPEYSLSVPLLPFRAPSLCTRNFLAAVFAAAGIICLLQQQQQLSFLPLALLSSV